MLILLNVSEYVDLVDCALLKLFVFFKSADLNDFDCVLLAIILVNGPVYLSVCPFTDYFVKCVVLYYAYHHNVAIIRLASDKPD